MSAIRNRRLGSILAALCWLLGSIAASAANDTQRPDGPQSGRDAAAHGMPAPEPADSSASLVAPGSAVQSPSVPAGSPRPRISGAVLPALQIPVDRFDVGSVPFGVCIRDSFSVENVSADTITLLAPTLLDPASEITILSAPTGKVPPKGLVTVVFEYCARHYGCDMAWIGVSTSAGERDSVDIYGCTADPTAILGYDTLDFGAVSVGKSIRRTYAIPGTTPYRVQRVDSLAAAQFRLVTEIPEYGLPVPKGEQGVLEFTFKPVATSGFTGRYRVLVDGGWRELLLKGAGVSYPLSVDPYPLSFGQVKVGDQRVLKLDVTNLAGVGVIVNTVRITPGPFDLALGEPRTFFLDVDQRRPIFFSFAPTSPGEVRRLGYLLGATETDTLAMFELVGNGQDTTTTKPVEPVIDRRVWLDTDAVEVGQIVTVTLRVAPALTRADTVRWITAEIAIPQKSFHLVDVQPGADAAGLTLTTTRLQDGRVQVEVRGNGDSVLLGERFADLQLRGLSTGQLENDLPLPSAALSRATGTVTTAPGRVLLFGCSVGTIEAVARRVSIRSVAASADASSAIVRYTAPSGASGEARVVDLQGRRISRVPLPTGTGEETEARISLDAISPGLYLLQLQMADDAVAMPMMVAP